MDENPYKSPEDGGKVVQPSDQAELPTWLRWTFLFIVCGAIAYAAIRFWMWTAQFPWSSGF